MAFAQKLLNGLQEFMDEMRERIRLAVLPKGSIIMFHGTKIPTGWHICDGTNGTPNLQGRYPMGCKNNQTTGTYIPAGLPNITGKAMYIEGGKGGNRDTVQGNGAFNTITRDVNGTGLGANDWSSSYRLGFDFNASRVSSVYGKSNTVTPETISLYFIMKITD